MPDLLVAKQEEKKKVPYKEGKQLNIRLSDEEYAELERRAKETGKSYKELICSEMELGRDIEVASPIPRRKKGEIIPFTEADISDFLRDGIERHKSFWGLDLVAVAKDVSNFGNWKELSECDQAYLLMLAKHRHREDPEELAETMQKISKILEADPTEIRAMLRRIVKSGNTTYDLVAE